MDMRTCMVKKYLVRTRRPCYCIFWHGPNDLECTLIWGIMCQKVAALLWPWNLPRLRQRYPINFFHARAKWILRKIGFFLGHFDRAWLHHLWSEVKYFCIFEFLGQKSTNKELFRFLEWFLGFQIEQFQKWWKFPQIPIQIGVKFCNFRRIHWRVPRSFLYKTASDSRYLYDFVQKNVWLSHSNFSKVVYSPYLKSWC